MKVLQFVLYYLILFLIPVFLIISWGDVSSDLVKFFETLLFWLVLLSILYLFKDGITGFIVSVSRRLGKAKLPGGVEFTFHPQEDVTPIEEKTKLDQDLEQTKKELNDESSWAWYYFLLYIASRIYGTQFRLLEKLIKFGPQPIGEIKLFYEVFCSKGPKNATYPFASYLSFLMTNFLIQLNKDSLYEITHHGRVLIEKLKVLGYTSDKFTN